MYDVFSVSNLSMIKFLLLRGNAQPPALSDSPAPYTIQFGEFGCNQDNLIFLVGDFLIV